MRRRMVYILDLMLLGILYLIVIVLTLLQMPFAIPIWIITGRWMMNIIACKAESLMTFIDDTLGSLFETKEKQGEEIKLTDCKT